MSIATVSAPASSPGPANLPAGACDAHSHIFGPFDRFPPRQASIYALPEADAAVHRQLRKTLGVRYGVLTQPAPYGDDPAAMFAAIGHSGGALKGVAVATPDVSDATLTHWHEGGIVGLRFTELRTPGGDRYPGSEPFDSLIALAPRLRALGMHAQLWASGTQFAEWLPRLAGLGVPLVLDHMAMPDVAAGVASPAFRAVIDALGSGDVWIKLVLSRVAPNPADARPFHDTLVAARPDRMLWGSDWPYVRMNPAPDAGRMLATFVDWVDDPVTRRAILADNPARLYRFPGVRT